MGIWNSSATLGAQVSSFVSPDSNSILDNCVRNAKMRSSLEKLLTPLNRNITRGCSSGNGGIA